MVRSYLKHGPTEAFGLICSTGSNSVWDGRFAYVPALEDVLVWDVKRGQMMAMWHETGHRAEVTCIQQSPNKDTFAVGYADGSIRLWNATSRSVISTFNGHKKAVSALAFDSTGFRLASGSQDTDLILWDVVGEAGLFRLHGHRDQVTGICFLSLSSNAVSRSTDASPANFLLTTSKDTFMKLWNLSTQHCLQTVVAHPSEIWTLDVNPEQNLVFTGSAEGELKSWRVDQSAISDGLKENEKGELSKMLHFIENVPLSTSHRVSQLSFHPNLPFLAVHTHDKSIDIFRIRTQEEVKRKQARRKRREKEKSKSKQDAKSKNGPPEGADEGEDAMDVDDVQAVGITDLFTPYLVVRTSGKIRSFAFSSNEQKGADNIQLLAALSTNAVEVFTVPTPAKRKEEAPVATRAYSLDLPGHRTDVRTLSLSSDDQMLASASNGSLKIWNLKTTGCIRTMDCSYAICSTFLPGDRQIAIGTKSGEILLYDVASSSLAEIIKAHSSVIWSLHVRPDQRGLVSGSADKDVKFWEFEHNRTGNANNPAISSLTHVRTLKMTDDVLSVRFSPNGKMLAVSLLDSTVKLFYEDSLKFFLSLYGHKLPVLSMDISSDSKLIVTCSADKNVKIWGLDFGDCHRSIFAHDESIMQVAFEKASHNFWTVGKDKLLKYWDGDKFELIQKLDGHHSEIWALAVSHEGKFVVTGSHDKSIRVWEKLDEPLFLEEEREREMEQLYETGLTDTLNRTVGVIGSGAQNVEAQNQSEASAVTKQTTETLVAGERILEALDLADAERAALAQYRDAVAGLAPEDVGRVPLPQTNAILAAYEMEPEAYVLKIVEKINNSALMDALLVLPFGKVISLMVYLDEWAKREWNIPLVSRIMFFLLKTHHHQIVTHRVLRLSLIPLRKHLRAALFKQKEVVGYNLAALQYLRRQDNASRTTTFAEELISDHGTVRKSDFDEGDKKRKRIAILS